jgi:hypothetical protein
MWMTALVGMATKYAEAVLAVRYRQQDARGEYVDGPMYYIRNGLGQRWRWLAILFALIAGFGIGNMVQANSVAHALKSFLSVPERSRRAGGRCPHRRDQTSWSHCGQARAVHGHRNILLPARQCSLSIPTKFPKPLM